MRPAALFLVLALAACSQAPQALEGPTANAERGRLLYDTACSACHTTQPHWRENRAVHSWDGLIAQVQRWQATAGQNWSAADVEDVASFLNERFYHLPLRRLPG
jgi:mono/diheme cytochrome c family protein